METMDDKKAFLIILDGWGHGKIPEVSAIEQAKTPFMDSLYENYPHAELTTFGNDVGLPKGQMGNSEVGHLNLGAGRVVFQELARINNAVEDQSLQNNAELKKAINYAQSKGKQVHIMALLSDGGVHSHINHIIALSGILNQQVISHSIHTFLDGRDTSPHGGLHYLDNLQSSIKGTTGKIASIIGRYYAMDRDNRWERIKKAYDLLVNGKGTSISTDQIPERIQSYYDDGLTDEFMEAISISDCPNSTIENGDVVIFANFRTDRPRQLTKALSQEKIEEFGMTPLDLHYVTMTEYDESFKNIHVMFTKENIKNTLGQTLAKHHKKQLRIAETEKYPHVTFFFNGGAEQPSQDEDRIMVPSPKVATYDLQPEMSAAEIKTKVVKAIEENLPDFICLNFANTDMVGHTGDMDAAIKSAETVDACLAEIIPLAKAKKYNTIIIADHGNADIMVNPDGTAHTAHTTNMVPIIVISPDDSVKEVSSGKLADIAPTLLHLMQVDIPEDMTGNVLVKE